MSYNPYGYPSYAANPNIQSGASDIQGVTWVNTIDEVRSTFVPFGKQIFMDRNQDVFYVKDSNGAIKRFEFNEAPIPSTDPANYVTRQEFDELRQQYEQLVAANTAAGTTEQTDSTTDNATNEQLSGNTGGSKATVLQPNSINENDKVPAQQPIRKN